MVDFDEYFLVEPLRKFQDVLLMRDFMANIAPAVWPLDKRKGIAPRPNIYDSNAPYGCHAKQGNPFGPFWDHSNITFVDDIYYGNVIREAHDISSYIVRDRWKERFPVTVYPVLSFIAAPVSFPAQRSHHHLQHFLQWSKPVAEEANRFIESSLRRPFVGVHLRNDIDWKNVCDLVKENSNEGLFGSAICTGKNGVLTKEMCLPSLQTIVQDIREKVKALGARSVFVSSDRNHYINELSQELAPLQVFVERRYPENLHVNLAILSLADHFIGNCVSTLSSFIYRQRKYASSSAATRSTSFFAQLPTSISEEL